MLLKIAPSILSADFGKLNAEIEEVDPYCDMIHVDVMDGHFVPNITFGPHVVAKIKSRRPLDVHLMIEEPEKYIERFVEAGASSITIHREVFKTAAHLKKVLKKIKKLGCCAAVSINPKTPLSKIADLLGEADMVLLMTVQPGFGGQGFMHSVLPKIRELRKKMPKLDIQVDGGINSETIKDAARAGANIFVAGNAIFGQRNRKSAVQILKNALTKP